MRLQHIAVHPMPAPSWCETNCGQGLFVAPCFPKGMLRPVVRWYVIRLGG